MKYWSIVRVLSSKVLNKHHQLSIINSTRLYSSQPQENEVEQPNDDIFDSSFYELEPGNGNGNDNVNVATWDDKYRDRVKSKVFGEVIINDNKKNVGKSHLRVLEREAEKRNKAAILARALLDAAVEDESEEEVALGDVKEEDQKSLTVGIIGAPNAGKSALTNSMVGSKVAAVSRKTNTTTHEVLGVITKRNTQICFFDTPGLMLKKSGFPYNDIKVRNESAWSSISLYDLVIVIFDVHRHLTRPDSRVVRLIERMGSKSNSTQKRILCMNKVDLVEKKKDLMKVVDDFKDLPGYERCFMLSGLKGWGVKDLAQYLTEQAVERPWDEDPFTMTEEVMKNISLEIVREKLLDHIHQEVPYNIEHRLMDWKEMRDGSLRIEQHFITPKVSQRKILVGKKGAKIGRIGMEANEELRSIFKRNVHLILMVRVK
ncbi:RNA metabolism protein [Lithospermum erythrorhizon]|uniref:GTP-binding protein ERG n=1 Tax=Lithospermum erythrorhizon TaxID=34254 RepID=A0AAV3Q9N6_LITER